MRQVYVVKNEMRKKAFKKMATSLNESSKPNLFYMRNSKGSNLSKNSSETKIGHSLLRNSISGFPTTTQGQEENDEDYFKAALMKKQSTMNTFERGLNSFYNKSQAINM